MLRGAVFVDAARWTYEVCDESQGGGLETGERTGWRRLSHGHFRPMTATRYKHAGLNAFRETLAEETKPLESCGSQSSNHMQT